jgi:DNA-binding PadR family transcriptional regulator
VKIERELMRGAGPVAVLKLLAGGAKYGYELVEALSAQTAGDGAVDALSHALQPGSSGVDRR